MVGRRKGFTFIEIIVALSIFAFITALVVVRYNLYEARQAARSAAFVMMSDLRLQQQRAFAVDETQGITICPQGNRKAYRLWAVTSAQILRTVNFDSLFPGNIRFSSGQAGVDIQFFPGTSTGLDNWAVVQSNTAAVNAIRIEGGDTQFTIRLENDGRLRLEEQKL